MDFSRCTFDQIRNINRNLNYIHQRFGFNSFNKNYLNLLNFLIHVEFLSFDILILYLQCEQFNLRPVPVIEKLQTWDAELINTFKHEHLGIENFDFIFAYMLQNDIALARKIFYITNAKDNNCETLKIFNKNLSKNILSYPFFNTTLDGVRHMMSLKLLTKFELIINLFNLLYM